MRTSRKKCRGCGLRIRAFWLGGWCGSEKRDGERLTSGRDVLALRRSSSTVPATSLDPILMQKELACPSEFMALIAGHLSVDLPGSPPYTGRLSRKARSHLTRGRSSVG